MIPCDSFLLHAIHMYEEMAQSCSTSDIRLFLFPTSGTEDFILKFYKTAWQYV